MNHSCDPNLQVSFENVCNSDSNGPRISCRVIRPVAAGEELCISYGPCAVRMKRDSRRQVLREQYHFTCTCTACTANTPSIFENRIVLKCPACGAPLPRPTPASATDSKDIVVCVSCSHATDVTERTPQLLRARQLQCKAMDLMDVPTPKQKNDLKRNNNNNNNNNKNNNDDADDGDDAVKLMRECLSLASSVLHPLCLAFGVRFYVCVCLCSYIPHLLAFNPSIVS